MQILLFFPVSQFKKKKKRAVNPDAPPRPNLLSQDKKLLETTEAFDRLHKLVAKQADEIDSLKTKYENMQASVNQILNYLRKGR